jgi:hypothetical protein
MKEQPMSDEKTMGQVIQIDEARIREHLGEMVRGTVEETLNAMLEAEADQLCGAGRYERSKARQDTRAGNYERTLQTQAGEVSLKVPKLRRLPGRPIMSQSCCSQAPPHRSIGLVDEALHEHATPPPIAGHANRSRRLIQCAKDSGHYRVPAMAGRE